jgi:hypothetical protein
MAAISSVAALRARRGPLLFLKKWKVAVWTGFNWLSIYREGRLL